jgi:hypothetical protein
MSGGQRDEEMTARGKIQIKETESLSLNSISNWK